ncbi:MAG: TetR/AcrR family transcriptional regulator, partial [Paracoccaceae bacterium]
PEIYGVAKALMIMSETDDAAKLAWDGRLKAVREGCRAAIDALQRSKELTPEHSADHATDILLALLSVQTWEQLTFDRGWSQDFYIVKIKALARQILVKEPDIA